jgi:hypothetical protein
LLEYRCSSRNQSRIVAVIVILVGIAVVVRAVEGNENRAESEQDREQMERASGEQRP